MCCVVAHNSLALLSDWVIELERNRALEIHGMGWKCLRSCASQLCFTEMFAPRLVSEAPEFGVPRCCCSPTVKQNRQRQRLECLTPLVEKILFGNLTTNKTQWEPAAAAAAAFLSMLHWL